ncbi:MAG: 30S ribosomal protein S20 [Capsulimonadaceae bacterium]|nr:30S ribosomal protein S20 [Capsulimonadaceae bacterium]
MPNIKSVKKDVIRSRKRHERNIAAKSHIKTLIKKARTAIDAKQETVVVAELVTAAISATDRAAKRGIIHKNAAARRKSRLVKRQNAVAAAA